jgi:DNA polymerase-3 subunit delta'
LDAFEQLPEQAEAKRLLRAALSEGPAHAYLFHGPAGVGKREAAFAFAGELLGDARRSHPDLYVVEPVGDQIRIDEIRALRRDLHMTPFEAARRVYLVLDADELNRDAADALLKDLEEPPSYAVIVLVADELGPIPVTIRSRCQPVAFRRLSERAVRAFLAERAPELSENGLTALARVSAGRLDRAEWLLEPEAQARRAAVLDVARSVYFDPDFEPSGAARRLLEGVEQRGEAARERAEHEVDPQAPAREAEQYVKRVERGAERDELLAALDELSAWYRDLVVVAAGAESAAVNADRHAELQEDATTERMLGAERACELVREAWRTLEELNVNPQLALSALFVRLRTELAGPAVAV